MEPFRQKGSSMASWSTFIFKSEYGARVFRMVARVFWVFFFFITDTNFILVPRNNLGPSFNINLSATKQKSYVQLLREEIAPLSSINVMVWDVHIIDFHNMTFEGPLNNFFCVCFLG